MLPLVIFVFVTSLRCRDDPGARLNRLVRVCVCVGGWGMGGVFPQTVHKEIKIN